VTYSKTGLQLTERFEGCRLTSYQDSRDIWTIGYGHTSGVHAGMTCTQAQAEAWLKADVYWAESEVNRHVHVSLTQSEFDALVDFTFNCGGANLSHSTLLKLLNENDTARAAVEFAKWDRAGGVELPGLLRRRKAEAAEFQNSL
jgi:lysozyme